MGMFDYVTFEGKRYQSKDTPDQFMNEYRIVDGRLIGDEWHMEQVPKEERPYPYDEGIKGFFGSLRRVVDKADVDLNWHGYLEIVSEEGPFEIFRLKFTDGSLVGVDKIEG